MPVLLQLAQLTVLAAGMGYWVWRWARKPAPVRSGTWLWCGLAGLCLTLLLLQALVYADWPLRQTAPFLWMVAAAGFASLTVTGWRARRTIRWRRWREICLVLGAGAAARAFASSDGCGGAGGI